MFFLHFLYFMDNFYKFLRFYGIFQKVNTAMQAIFAEKTSRKQLPENFFYKAQ